MKAHHRSRPYGDVRLVDGLDREDEGLTPLADGQVRCGCGAAVYRHHNSATALRRHKTPQGRPCPQRRLFSRPMSELVADLPPVMFRGREVTTPHEVTLADHDARSEVSRNADRSPLPGDPWDPLPASTDPLYARLRARRVRWLRARDTVQALPPRDSGWNRPKPNGHCHGEACGMRVTGERLYCGPCMVDRHGTR